MVPDDVAAFGADVAATLRSALGDRFVGAYFVGSIALGGFVPNESDVDMIVVCDGHLVGADKDMIADEVVRVGATCPARGLELTVYNRDVVGSPPGGADFEVNANGGPRMERSVHLDAAGEPWFWYVLDRAIAFRCGVRVEGPTPAELFVEVGRTRLLDAMLESIRWHAKHEGATLYSVLNACRAWRFAADDVLGSKLEGAAWARTRWSGPDVIDAAVDLRHGRSAALSAVGVVALLRHVERELHTAT